MTSILYEETILRFDEKVDAISFAPIDHHIPGDNDSSLRPNQIFSVGGLTLPILEGPDERRLVDVVEDKLLTPVGLRSLVSGSPHAPRGCPFQAWSVGEWLRVERSLDEEQVSRNVPENRGKA